MPRIPEVWTIVVAAGSGQRFGGSKQLAALGDRRVLDHAMERALTVSTGVVVVTAPDQVSAIALTVPDGVTVVAGGATRADSVRAGLAVVPDDADCVLVHDAARPLATRALFDRVIAAVADGAEAVVPAVAVTDTIRHRSGGVIDRTDLVAVQTPQGFPASTLRAAHRDGVDATDDAGLVERAGGRVRVIDGESTNLKITRPVDLVVAEALLRERT